MVVMLTRPARLCWPCRLAGPAHAAATARFSIQEGEIPRETDCLLEGEDSNYWYRGTKAVDFRSIPGIVGYWRARKRYHLMVQPLFFCALNHSIEPGWGTV